MESSASTSTSNPGRTNAPPAVNPKLFQLTRAMFNHISEYLKSELLGNEYSFKKRSILVY
jgi:hypothetical protein